MTNEPIVTDHVAWEDHEYRVLYNEPDPNKITGDRPWVAYQGDDIKEAERIYHDVINDSERGGLSWNVQLQARTVSPWYALKALLTAETVEEATQEDD